MPCPLQDVTRLQSLKGRRTVGTTGVGPRGDPVSLKMSWIQLIATAGESAGDSLVEGQDAVQWSQRSRCRPSRHARLRHLHLPVQTPMVASSRQAGTEVTTTSLVFRLRELFLHPVLTHVWLDPLLSGSEILV